MRIFTDFLRDWRRGRVVDDLSEALADVVKAVDATNKAGSLTAKITVKPSKDEGWEKGLAISISTTLPRKDSPDAVFFSNADGDLIRDDPDQRPLFADTDRPERPQAVG